MRRRRRTLSRLPTKPKLTPLFVYIFVALLCVGGLYLSKQNLVKVVSGKVVDAYSGQPLGGVTLVLTNDRQQARTAGVVQTFKASTDNYGAFQFPQATDTFSISAENNNYKPYQATQSGQTNLEVKMVPTLLRGQVKDAQGNPLPRTQVSLGSKTVETAADGSFSFSDVPETGVIQARASGYRKGSVTFNKSVRADITLQQFNVKAAFIAPADAAVTSNLNSVLSSLNNTELTAVVIDLKDESGKVLFDSKVPEASAAIAANDKKIPDLAALVKTLQDKNYYVIARIVGFQDPVLTDVKPDWTLKSKSTGKPWADTGGYNWINPYKRDSWEYYLGLADEAAKAGVDEVQFDGFHFPVLGALNDINYELPEGRTSNESTRMDTINAFFKAARDRLSPLGVYTSATVYGTALVEADDLGIGMNVAQLAPQVDYISPLIYPSEWSPGAFGIDQPAQKPYDLVQQAMLSAKSALKERISQVRPWLQDFNPPNGTYGASQVRDEIRAVEEVQKTRIGWVLYNSNSRYNVDAIPPKS
ncbi:MAG: hypothetical protein BGO39_29145 [Chloroflexi bacterium 54-19]|nr:MAG: hypothetical protein BGO39_29145 [Chloroflexi bacterium 54-19]